MDKLVASPAVPALTREQIGRRGAALLADDAVVNLGAGLPALVANFLHGRAVILHSENGVLKFATGYRHRRDDLADRRAHPRDHQRRRGAQP
jgi:acyl CoA:acetate/3-ketoacid CoA transferase beta subunit